MTMKVVEQHLGKVVLFQIAVTLFSAFRRASSEGIKNAKGVDLHADEVLTLGSQRVFDKEQLNIFNRLKAKMERICLKYGVPFLKDYAVPDEVADACASELDDVIKEANIKRDELIKNYDDLLEKFCEANPTWRTEIKARAFDKTYIADRIKFRYYPVKLSVGREDGAMAEIMSQEVGGMLGSLLTGIAEAAEKLQEESLSGKKEVTRKALRPLKSIRDKLNGFTFLEPRVQSLIDMIDETIAAMPDKGAIEGTSLTMLWGLTSILADPRKAMKIAESFESNGAAAFLAMIRPQSEAQLVARPVAQSQLRLPETALQPTASTPRLNPMGGALPAMPSRAGMPQGLPPAMPRQSMAGLFGGLR